MGCLIKGMVRVAAIGCGMLALQPIVGKVPVIGWFLTIWPVTWGLWVYLASMVIREARPYLHSSDNPRIPTMGLSALIGGVSGLVGALCGVILNSILASAAASMGPDGALAAAGYGLSASFGLLALITRPFWGVLVCGTAGLFMGGAASSKQLS